MGGKGSGTVDGALLRLDGTKIEKDGSSSKTDFFDFLNLPIGDYSHIVLTPEQAIKLRNFAVRLKYGTSAMIPLKCVGPNCPIKNCPFEKEKNWPIAEPCPIEGRLVQVKTQDYVDSLNINTDNAADMSLVNQLVELDIMDFRVNAGLSGNTEAQSLMQQIVFSKGDSISTQNDVHPLVTIKRDNHRARIQILESLAATRKEQYKKAAALKKSDEGDAAHHLAKLRKMFEQITGGGISNIERAIKEANEAEKSNIEEADWEVVNK